jgi:hypothetical protein
MSPCYINQHQVRIYCDLGAIQYRDGTEDKTGVPVEAH